jgi:hypothetical protein
METSLHRELKRFYADRDSRFEVTAGPYRIDVVSGERFIEIQHGHLAAIRDKVRRLLEEHPVVVVKPVIVRKEIIRQARRGGPVVGRRKSPKQGRLLDVFHELVHFTRVFPHPRLTLDVPLVDIEEWRYPGHGRRRRWRADDHLVENQRLVRVHEVYRLRTAADLAGLLPGRLPKTFHTGELAEALGLPRWIAQRICYCLRQTGAAREVGKRGNALLYQLAHRRRALCGLTLAEAFPDQAVA